MARPYAQLSPQAIAQGEATAGAGSGGGTIGSIPLDLASARYIETDDIPNAATGAADASGGLLSVDTTPALERVNVATDKALRIVWVASNQDEMQFAPVYMPPDFDSEQDATIHILARMSGATDTPVIDVQVFDAIGDTEMGGDTAALSATLAELSVTISSANLSGHPLGFLNVSLVPGAHTTDILEVYAAWIEYQSTSANTGSENVTGTLHVRDEKSSTTAGGSPVVTTWTARDLNTVVTNTISGASLATDQITLPTGTYEIEAYAPFYGTVLRTNCRLYDTTAAAVIFVGTGIYINDAENSGDCLVTGRFTLTETSVLELQYHCASAQANNGLGLNMSITSTIEVFANVTIKKIST